MTKIDLAVIKVNANPGSSFVQTMIGRSPLCYIQIFVEIGPQVLVKQIFEGFLQYMDMATILVMCPASYQQVFISMYLKAHIQNLVKNGPVVSEKSVFYFSYINGLGPRSRNDLDLQYSFTFINSNSCLHLPTLRSHAVIVSKNATVFTFSGRKA